MTAAATSQNQDFITFQGDAPSPIFTVVDSNGDAVDISGATAISWSCQVNSAEAAALTLTLLGGQIALVGGGTGGQFTVNLSSANTTALNGTYNHFASITLGGKVLTVMVGRMRVGPTSGPYSYDPTKLGDTDVGDLYQVRRLLGDVLPSDWQMTDAEIRWFITQRTNVYGAAADCARALAAQFSRKVDVTTPNGMSTNNNEIAAKYLKLAAQLDAQSINRGAGAIAYAGGISVADKVTVQQNSDRVQPSFNIGLQDAMLPVPQVGNETPTLPMSGSAP